MAQVLNPDGTPAATTQPLSPVVGGGLIGGNVSPNLGSSPTPASTGYSPALATAASAASQGYSATMQAPVVNSSATTRSVDPTTETVQGQLSGIIAANSPLMQQAQAQAKQAMNDRGLGDSSLAVGAAQGALYSAAEPIAASDANTYSTTASQNMGAENTAALQNAAQANTVNANNAQFSNAAGSFTAAAANAAALANAQSATNVAETNASNVNAAGQFTAGAKNQAALIGSQLESQQKIAAAGNLSQQTIAGISTASQQKIADANNASSQIIANLNSQTQLQVQQATAASQKILQTDASAAQLHAQTMQTVASIEQNVNLSSDQKAAAVQDQLTTLNNALGVLGVAAESLGSAAATSPTGSTTAGPEHGFHDGGYNDDGGYNA